MKKIFVSGFVLFLHQPVYGMAPYLQDRDINWNVCNQKYQLVQKMVPEIIKGCKFAHNPNTQTAKFVVCVDDNLKRLANEQLKNVGCPNVDPRLVEQLLKD